MGKLAVSFGHALGKLLARNADAGEAALLIPPAIPGSLGDAAMLSVSARLLREHGIPTVDLLYGKQWPLDERVDRRIRAERFFYRQSPVQQSLLVARLHRYAQCHLIGADVIDGAYNPRSVNARLFLLAEAARMGKAATLLGASYNRQPEETTRQALRALPASVAICARDPVSRDRMECALDRPIRQVADLAFLLNPCADHPEAQRALHWIESRRRAGDRVIGLNANYLHAEKNPQIPAALERLVTGLLGQSLSILLLPHDTRSARPDRKLLEEATAAVAPEDRQRLHMLPPTSPGVVRAVAPALELIVTGRMHAAILGLSAATPPFCFAYQDKFEGLFRLFDLEDADLLATPASLARRPDAVVARIVARLKDLDALRRRISENLPAVIALSKANFVAPDRLVPTPPGLAADLSVAQPTAQA